MASSVSRSTPTTSTWQADAGMRAIVQGVGCVRERLAAELDDQGVQRPLLVCGAQVHRSPVFAIVHEALVAWAGAAGEVLVFGGSRPHSPSSAIEAGAAFARAHDVDGFVAVGGSSSIDTAKGIAVLCATGCGRVADLSPPAPGALAAPMSTPPGARRFPVLSATTTLSYAEMYPFWGTRRDDTGKKAGYGDHGVVTRTVFLDGELAAHTPDDVWFETAVKSLDDALLVHLRSGGPEPFLDPLLVQGISGVLAGLASTRRAAADDAVADEDARQQLMTAMALTKFSVPRLQTGFSPAWFARAVRYALGARYQTSHGSGTCIAMAEGLRFHSAATLDRQHELAASLGLLTGATDPTSALTGALDLVLEPLGVPRTLTDVGLDASHVEVIAADMLATMPDLGTPAEVVAAVRRLGSAP